MKFTNNRFRIFLNVAATERQWLDPLKRKLIAFGKLPHGWSHGEGVPVSQQAIRIASEFVDVAIRLQLKADVFPGLNGECSVTFYRDEKSVEVIIGSDGADRFGLHVERGNGFQYEALLEKEDATHEEVVRQITQLLTEAWKSPESYRCVSSTQSRVAFRTSSSSTPQGLTLTHLTGS